MSEERSFFYYYVLRQIAQLEWRVNVPIVVQRRVMPALESTPQRELMEFDRGPWRRSEGMGLKRGLLEV